MRIHTQSFRESSHATYFSAFYKSEAKNKICVLLCTKMIPVIPKQYCHKSGHAKNPRFYANYNARNNTERMYGANSVYVRSVSRMHAINKSCVSPSYANLFHHARIILTQVGVVLSLWPISSFIGASLYIFNFFISFLSLIFLFAISFMISPIIAFFNTILGNDLGKSPKAAT